MNSIEDTGAILAREFPDAFINLMKNRVLQSYYKYGAAKDNFGGGRVDPIATAMLCLDAFEKDKNAEHLIDAANYLKFAFDFRLELGFTFRPTGDSESVGTVGTPINMEKE